MFYQFDISKLESEIKISKAMINVLENIKKEKGSLSRREQEDLDYHKQRLATMGYDLEKEKRFVDEK